jgi:excisionase family DNA binding protein
MNNTVSTPIRQPEPVPKTLEPAPSPTDNDITRGRLGFQHNEREGDRRQASFLTKRQAAAHLQISERTLCTWMSRRLVPYIRIGRCVRFRKSDLDEKTGIHFESVRR